MEKQIKWNMDHNLDSFVWVFFGKTDELKQDHTTQDSLCKSVISSRNSAKIDC